ncbi:hypothetical protein ACFOWU_07620 [Epilithonimonas zeae]|uniref:hypothetical protein n=1 Tax=Epilithonimonas zeae TaxID=1416779 RepID=UPI000940EE1F|nr:hypothetical protein [Epilithonimonas zeae]
MIAPSGLIFPAIKGVQLSKKPAPDPQVLFFENMLSRNNIYFSVNLQFNAEKHCIELLFNRKLNSIKLEYPQYLNHYHNQDHNKKDESSTYQKPTAKPNKNLAIQSKIKGSGI